MCDLGVVPDEPIVQLFILLREVLSQLGLQPLAVAGGKHCHVCMHPLSMLAEIPPQRCLVFLGWHGLQPVGRHTKIG